MTETRLYKCCACNKNKVDLTSHLKRRHNLFWRFLGKKSSNRRELKDEILQKYHTDFRKRVHIAIDNVIASIRDPDTRKIVQNDKILKKFIKSRLGISLVMEKNKRKRRKLICEYIRLTVRFMKISWEKLHKDDFQDLTISTLMIPAHTQVMKDSLMQLSQHSSRYPGKILTLLRGCASLIGTESDFSIICNEIVEFFRAGDFCDKRRRSCSSDVERDDEDIDLPAKRKRRVCTYWEEESNDSIIDDEEWRNDNSIQASFGEDSEKPQLDGDEQAVPGSQVSTLSIDSLNNFSLILSRVDESRSDCLDDSLQAKQRLEHAEPEGHQVIAEQSTAESDQQSDEAVNDPPNVQSALTSFDLLDELVKILEDEDQQQTKTLEENCQELSTTLDTLQIRLNKVKIQLKTMEFSVSLNENLLEEQQKEQRLLQSDLESLHPSIEALTALLINSSDSSSVQQIQNRVKQLRNEYTNSIAKSVHRGNFLKEISEELHEFLMEILQFEGSQSKSQEPPELNFKDYTAKIALLENEFDERRFNLELLIRKGKNLVDKENITDVSPVREKIEALETQLKELNNALDEKLSRSSGHCTAYDVLLEQDHVLDWLTKTEERVARLHSTGVVNLKELKLKNEEFKVVQKEYMDYKGIIDRIGEFLMIHDSLLKEHGENLTKEPTDLFDFHLEESAPMVQLSEIRERYGQLRIKLSYYQSEQLVDDSILKEFLDGYSSLNSWLGTMERLTSAQERISIEPAIIDVQSKQIHLLQEEFRIRKPEFDHWVELGQVIRSTDSVKIDIKVKDIRQRWQYQIDHLDRRAQDLKDSRNSRSGFYSNVYHLHETLEKIAVDIDALPLDEHFEGQLIKIDDLGSKLEEQRSLLGETACTQLREALSAAKIPMQGKLTVIEELFKDLQVRFQYQKAKIEETLRDRRQFERSCSEMICWLAGEFQKIPEKLLISADQAVIQQQLDQYKKAHDAVEIKEIQAMELMDKGRDIMMKASKIDNEAMEKDLDKMQTQLDRLKKETFDKRIKLETCIEDCRRYYRDFSSLRSSVQETEVQLQNLMAPKSLTASVSGTGLDEHIQVLNSFAVDVSKRSEAFQGVKSLGETFLNSCDINTDVVENELKDMENRWLTLFGELNDYTVFNERLSNLRSRLLPYENRLTFYANFKNSSKDEMKKLREESQALEEDLQIVKGLAKKLANLPDAIDLQVIDVSDRISALGRKLDNLIWAVG